MAVTLGRLAVVPILIVGAVAGVPYVLGNQPLTWQQTRTAALAQISRLPGHPLTDQVDVDQLPVPLAPAPEPVTGSASASVKRAPKERYPVRRVRRPWQPGTAQLGVQIYWADDGRDPEKTVWRKAQRLVDYVTGLDANSITVSFPFGTPGIAANTVGVVPQQTPPPRRLEILMHEAAAAGLRVTVRPILDERTLDPPQGWRGNIQPGSVPAWFDSYRDFLTPYLKAAQRQRTASFVVGTELNSLEGEPEWTSLLAGFRPIFTGQLIYDLNYDNYGLGRYPPGMDGYRVDAYMKVKHASDSAPASVIERVWNQFFVKAAAKHPPPVILGEVGISARQAAYHYPGAFLSDGGVYDARIQPTWYQAACTVARANHLGGIYFWKVDFDADPQHPVSAGQPNMDFIGNPAAERAIRQCLSASWPAVATGTSGTTPTATPSVVP